MQEYKDKNLIDELNKIQDSSRNLSAKVEHDITRFDVILEEKPIKLIEFEGSKFKLNPVALDFLNNINEDLVIVSVVGKARTGKSYLLNLLLDNIGKSTKGFDVDSTINSCTKGIWIWGGYRKKHGSNEKIIFIDSEGTSSIDRSTKTYDSKIFALVVLISSLFIYNTTGNIDENSIAELSLAAHLSNSVASNATEEKESIILELSPKFIWVIRDFTLEKTLPGTDIEIDNNQYLDISLRKKTSGKNSSDNNMIRDNIIKYFPERECITLPRPVESEEELRNLKKIPFESLKSNFKLEYNLLKNKIYKEGKAKRFKGKAINGKILVNLITAFIEALNKGVVPNISNTWDSVIKDEINLYYENAINRFKNEIKALKSGNYEQEEICIILHRENVKAIMHFQEVLKKNPEIIYNNTYKNLFVTKENLLRNELDNVINKMLDENYEKTKKLNLNLFKNEYRNIQNKVFRNEYENEYLRSIKTDLNEFFDVYLSNSLGSNKSDVFTVSLGTVVKDISFYLGTTISSIGKNKILTFDQNLIAYKDSFKEITDEMQDIERKIEKQTLQMKNLEAENGWKNKESGYLNEKIKSLESVIEKLKLKEINDQYGSNSKNNMNITRSNFNNSMIDLENTNKSQENLKLNGDKSSLANSKITFEDGSGREECKCECKIY